jgi:DNA-binding LytR/AlgR family response regulator
VINCIIVDDDKLSRTVLRQMVERVNSRLELIGEFENAIEAHNILRSLQVDLMFLDVEMPEMTGLQLLKTLERSPQVILVTGGRQYAVEAFEYNVADYLVKPVEHDRFLRAINRVENNLQRDRTPTPLASPAILLDESAPEGPANDNEFVFVKTKDGGGTVQIRVSDIIYIEAQSDYMNIICESNRYVVHITMANLQKKLSGKAFHRVHRSYIVNINYIESIEGDLVKMPGRVIPIGVSYKSDFLKKLNYL